MKTSKTKPATAPETPVFQKTMHQLRVKPKAVAPGIKAPKRENTFSKSRDIREDRGARQMKTVHNPQTLPHGH